MTTRPSHRPQQPAAPAWRQALAAAGERPWLLAGLRRLHGRAYGRFVLAYRRLLALPGRVRRRWLARLGLSLAGAALLLTLHGLPSGGAAANIITVDGVTCTLIDAITAANTDTATNGCAAGSGPDVLDLTADVELTDKIDHAEYGDVGLPVINSKITIQGNGHTISRSAADGTPDFRIFGVGSGGDLTLESATVSNGKTQSSGTALQRSGGGIFVTSGAVSVANSTLSGNSASYGGGGISAWYDSTVNVANSTLSANSAGFGGGGIDAITSTVNVANSTLSDNSAGAFGGGIDAITSTVSVANSTLSDNSAGAFGGGIGTSSSTVSVAHSTLSGNSAGAFGGGIDTTTSTVSVANSTLSDNSAGNGGGGIGAGDDSTVSVANSTLSGNSAGFGGGIDAYNSTVSVANSTLSGNSAGNGGGIYARTNNVTVAISTLSGNSANYGGGIHARNSSTVSVASSTLSGNSVSTNGGIHASSGVASVANSTLSGNAVGSNGGGISTWYDSTVSVANTIVALQVEGGDCATNSGGAIISGNYNIDSDDSCGLTEASDQPNLSAGDLKLQALAANGGPGTGVDNDPMLTHGLDAGSVAIDRIPDGTKDCAAGISRDQREFVRAGGPGAGGAACDVGAFEYASAPPTPFKQWLGLIWRGG